MYMYIHTAVLSSADLYLLSSELVDPRRLSISRRTAIQLSLRTKNSRRARDATSAVDSDVIDPTVAMMTVTSSRASHRPRVGRHAKT